MLLGEFNRAFKCAAMRIADADVEHCRDAGITRARNYLFAIAIVLGPVDVAVRINELSHWINESLSQWSKLLQSCAVRHFFSERRDYRFAFIADRCSE